MRNSKTKKSRQATPAITAAEPQNNPRMWIYATALAIALFAAFEVYWPAIHGPFLLDDTHLTYMLPNAADIPFGAWVRQLRPLLMLTFWLNYQQSGAQETFGYHAVNVLLHFFNSIFIFLAVRKVLGWAGVEESRSRILSFFAAGLFLLVSSTIVVGYGNYVKANESTNHERAALLGNQEALNTTKIAAYA